MIVVAMRHGKIFGCNWSRSPLLMAALFCALAILTKASAQSPAQPAWSVRMANSTIQRWPSGRFTAADKPWHWNYELGTLLDGMDEVWYDTADPKYYHYIKSAVDTFVDKDGAISSYDAAEHSLDQVLLGRQLLLLYRVTQDKRYYRAAVAVRHQLDEQPKNAMGGYWHKQIYPNQMWLDGLYMAEPFFAEYASVFREPQDFAEITRQFVLIEQHTRDAKTGLHYHAWDESKQQSWANPATGTSPNFWGRGMGWYMMALVDTLPNYPENDPGRAQLLAILGRTADAVVRYQDHNTGLWYQVLDQPGKQGNYFESSAACMFTYALEKGVRLGYLPKSYAAHAQRAWQGIQSHFLQTDSNGDVTLTSTVQAIGLGGPNHRDGSYQYYVSAPVISNDPKGVGAFLLGATEMENLPHALQGLGSTVVLDAWYNSQTRTDAAGNTVLFHYKWDDFSDPGYSLFGHMWRNHGVKTETLTTAPTLNNLKGATYYLIVSPDNPAKNPHPNYMNEQDAEQVAAWVKQGGILILMENDAPNADISHLDVLADKFGLHFNNIVTHHVEGRNYEMGRMDVEANPPFTKPHRIFWKDTCSIQVSGNAKPLLQWKGETMIAMAAYGKGKVVALTDPWLYNEYTDGRIIPAEYDNFAAGLEYVRWLVALR